MTEDAAVKKAALLIATLSAFLTPFMVSSINIALPAIGAEFQMGAVLMSWVPTSYLLSAAMFLVPFGRLADIYGRKRIFTLRHMDLYGLLASARVFAVCPVRSSCSGHFRVSEAP